MKKTLLALFLMVSGSLAYGQQDPQFSQNMNNRLFPNPGVAGSNDAICAGLLGRHQWMGFEGKPETYLLTVHAPVQMLRGGVGLSLYSDKLGLESNVGAKLSYAYRMAVGTGNLGIGIGLGFMNKSIGKEWQAIDSPQLDNSIPDNGASDMAFDADFGVYYKNNDLYLGLSSTHLAESSFDDGLNFGYKSARHYYIMAGYNYELNANLMLKPNLFIKSDASSTQVDLNLGVEFNKMLYGGVSYRVQDAIVPIVGFKKEMGDCVLNIGYSYDVTTSLLRQHSSGSHEIFLGVCCTLSKPTTVQKHKTVRFL